MTVFELVSTLNPLMKDACSVDVTTMGGHVICRGNHNSLTSSTKEKEVVRWRWTDYHQKYVLEIIVKE